MSQDLMQLQNENLYLRQLNAQKRAELLSKQSCYADVLGLSSFDNFQIGNALLQTQPNTYNNGFQLNPILMQMLEYKLYQDLYSKYENADTHNTNTRDSSESISAESETNESKNSIANNHDEVKEKSNSVPESKILKFGGVASGPILFGAAYSLAYNNAKANAKLKEYSQILHKENISSNGDNLFSRGSESYKLNSVKEILENDNSSQITPKTKTEMKTFLKENDSFYKSMTERDSALEKLSKAKEDLKKAKWKDKSAARKIVKEAENEFNKINKEFKKAAKNKQSIALKDGDKYLKDIKNLKNQLKGKTGAEAENLIKGLRETAKNSGNEKMVQLLDDLAKDSSKLTKADISKALKKATKGAAKNKALIESAGKNLGRLSKMTKVGGKILGKVAIPLTIALESIDVINACEKDGGHFGKNAKKQTLKSGAGILASIGSGALVGTCVGGPVGTIAGIVVGAGMYFAGSKGGEILGDEIWKDVN